MNELIEFVKQHQIKQIPNRINRTDKEAQMNKARKAGFTALAYKISTELKIDAFFANYKNRLILPTPEFHRMPAFSSDNLAWMKGITNSFDIDYNNKVRTKYIVLETKKTVSGLFRTRKPNEPTKLLFEVPPQVYKEDVPINVLKAVVESQSNGVTSKVWFISSPEQFSDYIEQPLDPMVVGYPVIDDYPYVVVLGLWGTDITDFDKIFGGQE